MIIHLTRIVLVQIMYDTHEYIISTMSRYHLSRLLAIISMYYISN